jgi:hypothetical protein
LSSTSTSSEQLTPPSVDYDFDFYRHPDALELAVTWRRAFTNAESSDVTQNQAQSVVSEGETTRDRAFFSCDGICGAEEMHCSDSMLERWNEVSVDAQEEVSGSYEGGT